MADKEVVYNGVRMSEFWQQEIEAAQLVKTYVIGGIECQRVPYGKEDEDWGADAGPCHDCAVIKGQLHVQSCDVERCPICGGQALGCDCEYEGDDAEDEDS